MTQKRDKSFDKNMKLAEMIHADYRLLHLLPRFGIRLGFGDVTVAEICKKMEVDAELFTLICNIYAFDDYTPSIDKIAEIPLSGIMEYLRVSHSDYLNVRIPHIISHIQHLAASSTEESRKRQIVEQFCTSYQQDIFAHFQYEEQIVFPYIESLISGTNDSNFRIEDYADNHGDIEDKLHDLKNIVMKYIEPCGSDDANRDLLMDLFQLEEDLLRHTLIEEKIMVALVEIMENGKQ